MALDLGRIHFHFAARDRAIAVLGADASRARTLTGQTRPRHPSSARSASTAARKSPLYCSIIDSSRLPPVWPRSRACSSVGRRASSTRRASPSLRASASAHFRTSPGGSTPSSSRSCPELPPLSNIVTMACTLQPGIALEAAEQARQSGAAAEAPDVDLATSHRGRFYSGGQEPACHRMCRAVICDRDRRLRSARDLCRSACTAVVVYGRHAVGPAPGRRSHAGARRPSLRWRDLEACARRARGWQRSDIAVPLMARGRIRAGPRRLSAGIRRDPRWLSRGLRTRPVRRPVGSAGRFSVARARSKRAAS